MDVAKSVDAMNFTIENSLFSYVSSANDQRRIWFMQDNGKHITKFESFTGDQSSDF